MSLTYRASIFLLAAAIFLSQFYVLPSGLPQPSNFIFLFFAILAMLTVPRALSIRSDSIVYLSLFSFFLYVAFVNLIWSVYLQDASLNAFSLYTFYNLFVFHFVYKVLQRNSFAVRAVVFAVFLSIPLMLFFWVLGLGGYLFFPRYNGFFNDPNQMAFWVICSGSIFFILLDGRYLIKAVIFAMCAYLIFLTMSRSALLGMLFMLAGLMVSFIEVESSVAASRKLVRRLLGLFLGIVFLLLMVFYFKSNESVNLVMDRMFSTSVEEQANIRGYTRLFQYPEYLFFGAGQGAEHRFNSVNEIHSTWVGILFYYGIVGLVLFFVPIFSVVRRLGFSGALIACAPLIYGFTTFGARSTIFWVFFSSLFYVAMNRSGRSLPK